MSEKERITQEPCGSGILEQHFRKQDRLRVKLALKAALTVAAEQWATEERSDEDLIWVVDCVINAAKLQIETFGQLKQTAYKLEGKGDE